MFSLMTSLRDHSDEATRWAIAQTWKIDITPLDAAETLDALQAALTDPANTERIWENLTDQQRGALQTVIGSPNHKMPEAMFTRLHGEIHRMGLGLVQKENPHTHPQTDADALFYRGLIYRSYEQANAGARISIYVPVELVEALPTHKTAYDDLEADQIPAPGAAEVGELEAPPEAEIVATTTAIVDDMTTLLAHLQVYGADINERGLMSVDRELLLPYLLDRDDNRLDFLFGVGVSAELIEVTDGRAYPRRAETRRWLESKRSDQLKHLAVAWRSSSIYRDLWHVTGLHPEPTGWPYSPPAAREGVIGFLNDFVPPQAWWSLDEFILTVKEVDPDFQRPGGDYDSWYIRNDDGDYLNGFESWDAVEGALLEFYITGPLYWLAMVDLSMDAARLTAYGRTFINNTAWPNVAEQYERIDVRPDGTLLASRRVSRFERFQAMRFTHWEEIDADGTYILKLNADGIRRAGEQGINTGHIETFISRMVADGTVPQPIMRLLETWQDGAAAAVTIEQVHVLRTTSESTLDFIFDKPALRRYLGARLGPTAIIVRAGQWDALREALGQEGIDAQLRE